MYGCVSILFNKFNCKVFIFFSTYAFILFFWNFVFSKSQNLIYNLTRLVDFFFIFS